MKIGAIIQARTSSTRLPGKVLKELPKGSGITVLQQIIRRLKKSKNIDEVIVATTTESSDDAIVATARKENTKCIRGSLEDVLQRYYLAAKENSLDVIVRITGDCPCVDPDIVDSAISKHVREEAGYTSNVFKRTYPDGFDVEVLDFKVLEELYKKASQGPEREHVTLYIHNNPAVCKMAHLEADKQFYAPERRITLDTAEDYILLCAIYDELYSDNYYFGVREIAELFKKKPWLILINKKATETSFKNGCVDA